MPDPHVTIPDEVPSVQYTVGGTPDDSFIIPFSFFETTDIVVYDGADLVDPADYTVTGDTGTTGGYEGGTVLLDTPVSNTTITILRDVPIERTTDFPLSGPFNITALNTQLDELFAIFQQQELEISRAINFPDTDDTTLTSVLPVAATRANKILAFDANGNVVVSTESLDDIEGAATSATAAAASASSASSSASAASASASAAATSETNAEQAYQDALTAISDFSGNLIIDRFNGTGAQTDFTLTESPGSENNTYVFVSGVYQQKNTYNVTGTTLAFSIAPALGTNNIEVVTGRTAPIGVPGDGTVTASKLASSAITGQTSATIATGDSILFSDVNDSGNLKKDTVSNLLGLVSSGSLVLISTQTASSSTSVTFTGLSTTYKKYIVIIERARPASDDVYLYMRTGNGSIDSGATAYGYSTTESTLGTVAGDGNGSDDHIQLTQSAKVGNDTNEYFSGTIDIHDPGNTSGYAGFTFVGMHISGIAQQYHVEGDGIYKTGGAIDRVQFYFSTGNITSGTFKLYGLA